ncbi:TPA: lipopolysaccharide biosynthesis protein [Streptococcus suis]|nr:oligosaccharide flippase family protein [Streptococcus suis]
MKNNFLKNFIIIGGGTFISMLIGFITTPIITRAVDPNAYGEYSIFTLYSSIAVMILYLGMDQSLVRFYYDKDSLDYKRSLLYKCIQVPILLCVLALFAVFAIVKTNIWTFELGNVVLVLLCVYTFIQVIYRFSLLLVRLQYKSKLYSILGIINKIVYVVLALLFLQVGKIGDSISLIMALTIAAAVCLLVSIVFEKSLWFGKASINDQCEIDISSLVKYAFPYVFSMGITILFQTADKLALNVYGTYSDVGIYSSTMTLVNVFAIVQTSFNTLWAPMAVEHYSKNPDDKSLYFKGNQIITVIMFFIGLTLILFKDVFALLLGEKYREAAYILPFLIFNPIMYTISETTVNGLVFMKKSKYQVVVAIGACIVNIIGNAILVPKLGSKGAAISTGLSYIVFFSLRTFLSNRCYYVDFKLKRFYTLTFLTVLYAGYSTFFPSGVYSVIGYVICVTSILVLYKPTVLFCFQYLYKSIERFKLKYENR